MFCLAVRIDKKKKAIAEHIRETNREKAEAAAQQNYGYSSADDYDSSQL